MSSLPTTSALALPCSEFLSTTYFRTIPKQLAPLSTARIVLRSYNNTVDSSPDKLVFASFKDKTRTIVLGSASRGEVAPQTPPWREGFWNSPLDYLTFFFGFISLSIFDCFLQVFLILLVGPQANRSGFPSSYLGTERLSATSPTRYVRRDGCHFLPSRWPPGVRSH
jgi:hypothetical protein